jgi:hypothetical protein
MAKPPAKPPIGRLSATSIAPPPPPGGERRSLGADLPAVLLGILVLAAALMGAALTLLVRRF